VASVTEFPVPKLSTDVVLVNALYGNKKGCCNGSEPFTVLGDRSKGSLTIFALDILMGCVLLFELFEDNPFVSTSLFAFPLQMKSSLNSLSSFSSLGRFLCLAALHDHIFKRQYLSRHINQNTYLGVSNFSKIISSIF